MTRKRTKRIIAVFGGSKSDDVLAFAEQLGRAIADEKQILLTGGTGPDGPPANVVKNRAIRGAGSSPWVGVDRKTDAPSDHSRAGDWGFVITSDLDHKRNYLEALMSDAVIAVEGEKGTRSEVTTALSLRRPVALVGARWKDTCDRLDADSSRSETLDDLSRITVERFDNSHGANKALDTRLRPERIRQELDGPLEYKWFGADATAADVVRWIKLVVPDGGDFAGCFPVEVDATVAQQYEEWLKEHDGRVAV